MLFGVDGGSAQGNALRLSGDFGQAEIENLRVAAKGHEDVCRLDIAMNDALGVSRVEGVGNLNSQIQHRVRRQRPATDLVP